MTTGRINQVVTKPTRPSAPSRLWWSAGRLNRIHQMDTFNSTSQRENQVSNAKLTTVTEKQVRRKSLARSNCASGQFPPRQSAGILKERMRPNTRNLCSFQSNPTHWVAHNQRSPILADAPKDRKARADTSKPQVRTQTQSSRVGSQGAGVRSATTGKLATASPHIYNSPYCSQ